MPYILQFPKKHQGPFIDQKGGKCMHQKRVKLFVVGIVAILALTALQQAMNARYPTIQALVEEHYSGGAEILDVIPFSDGQAIIVNRESISTMSAMYVKPSLFGWKLIGVSSAHSLQVMGLLVIAYCLRQIVAGRAGK